MSNKVLLQDILEFTRDGEWGKEDPFKDSRHTRVIRGTDFEDIRIGKVNELPHRHVAERFVEYKELKPFDVLIETAGGSKNTPTGRTLLLKPSLFEKVDVPLVCASFARFLRFDDSKVVPEYLFWHLQYLYRNGVLKQYHVQHTGVARFQFTTFKENEYLELPDRETQQKIASTLSAFDDLIENNTRRIEILEEMTRRIYREWFVHFRYPGHQEDELVDSGTELGEIPEGWEVKSFDEISEVLSGGTPKTKINEYWDGNLPFFSPKDATENFFVHQTSRTVSPKGVNNCASELYPPKTVFITARGTVGKLNMPIVPMAMNQSCYALKAKDGLGQYYIFFSIENLVRSLQQKAHGAVFDTIIMDTFKQIYTIVPPLELAQKFERKVEPILEQIQVLLKKNERLKETRDLLLPKLISGKIDVHKVNKKLTR